MRRMRDDRGAVAVLVAILLPLVLLGFGALVVDAGSLYSERRQLQNAADAGALALAQICADGSNPICASGITAALTKAQSYADSNSKDGASSVKLVCGHDASNRANFPFSECSTQPPGIPAGASYVHVETQTGDLAGAKVMPAILGRVLNSGYNGKTVASSATAAYGGPSGLVAALPVTISLCEFNTATAGGTPFATAPFKAADEKVLRLHGKPEAGSCPSGPSGGDLPGGFGWLDTAPPPSGCATASSVNGTFADDTGVSVDKACKDALAALLNTTVFLPIYNSFTGNGSGGNYTMAGYAAFRLTGWNLPGTKQNSTIPGSTAMCKGDDKCLYGVFTKQLEPTTGDVGAPNMGVNVVALVG